MKLSVVTTLYRSAPYVREFHRRAGEAARRLAADYEIVFVNDGSPDDAFEIVRALAAADPRVVGIDLSRNFGHHKAMMTGLAYARGELVFLIDSDLEEEPELLEEFRRVMLEEQSDVVFGVQVQRKGGFFERLSGALFYKALNLLTQTQIPPNLVTARLMTRRYVRSLLRFRDREVFLAGLWSITGFRQTPVTITKHATSPSTYTLRRKVAVLVNSITSFSNVPLQFIFYVGLCISALALGYIAWLVAQKLVFGLGLEGWTSVMASIWLIGGLIICFLGVIGIYLAKIFSETKRRPYTIVREVLRGGADG